MLTKTKKTKKYSLIKTEIPGSNSLKIFNEEQKFIAPGTQTIATSSKIVTAKGDGALVEDIDGNRFIDFFAGVGVASLGYNHPKYVKYLSNQLAKIHVGSFTTESRAKLVELLAEVSPGDLNRSQFYSSGAEAVEAALRLAKSYTKKYEFISFWGGFHGKTMGVLGLLSDTFKNGLGPLPVGTFSTPYANCNHCPFNETLPVCDFRCVKFIEDKIRYETTNQIAAFIVEPIQGTNGNVIPPKGYLAELQKTAHKIGALLIVDEMITGFGRTGKMFGCQHDDIVPDIITIGKGFGGGFPMTGLLSNEEIINAKPFANPSGSSSSYGGNPIASAAAYITLKIIIEEGLVENSAKVGAFILERLKAFQEKFDFVSDVRGKGLMIGIELTKNKNSNEKLDKKYTQMIFQECLKRGLIIMGYNPDIRINPPLVITQDIAEEGIEILEEVFEYVSAQIKN